MAKIKKETLGTLKAAMNVQFSLTILILAAFTGKHSTLIWILLWANLGLDLLVEAIEHERVNKNG